MGERKKLPVRLFELRPDEAAEGKVYRYRIDATHKYLLPGVTCEVCRATWGNVGTAYPAVDLAVLPSVKGYVRARPVSLKKLDELRRPILPLLPDGSIPPPGTAFGPLVGTAQGQFGDFAWIGYWTLLIDRRALALLQSAGVRSLVAVTPQLRYRSKSPAELAELQIEPHARLASVALPPDAAPSCPACGRRNIKRPDRLVIDAASISAHLDLFRGRDLTTVIYATERFVAAARELKLSNIQCNEVEVKM